MATNYALLTRECAGVDADLFDLLAARIANRGESKRRDGRHLTAPFGQQVDPD
jgi:hypothetical protein